jgi:hypothetical protein
LSENEKIVIARPLRTQARMPVLPGTERSVSNRVLSNDILSNNPRNSATESIPAALTPFWGQWAVTPKLTMIAGQQLSIGAFPVWNALLDLTVA